MKIQARKMSSGQQRGFSLVELMFTLAILTIVIGVLVQGITGLQTQSATQTNKLDLTQETREFMDQIVNDLDQAGYPGVAMFDPSSLTQPTGTTPICVVNNNVACGFRSISSTAIQFEGDVDGSGVSEEWIQLVSAPGGTIGCTTPPCIIQRGTVSKAAWANGTGTLPSYYTEVNGVMNSTVFTAFNNAGNSIDIKTAALGQSQMSGIAAIGITLYVQSPEPDPQTGQYPTVTMVSMAKVTNKQNY